MIRTAFLTCGICVAMAANTLGAWAHEFWIEPIQYTPKLGAKVPIVFRIGQDFNGSTYPFVRALSERFIVADGRRERAVKTLDGDDPAAEITFANAGLAIVAHQRRPEEVVFETFAKFQEAAEFEGLETTAKAHQTLGKPQSGIRELYARCAKSLLSIGNKTEGADRAIGMTLELVATRNPYDLPTAEPLPLRLLYNGEPVAGVLVKTFNRDDPSSPRLARTDANGNVAIDVATRGEVLVSAVHMVEPMPGTGAHWISYWATLTFMRR